MASNLPDRGARKWLYKYAYQNYWRVAATMDLEDLIQEGYMAYAETRYRYPDAQKPAHIMSLFQLVFRSRIEDRVRRQAKKLDDAASDYIEANDEFPDMVIPDPSTFLTLLAQAPKRVRDVLALHNDKKARVELCKPFDHVNGHRETLNERFCRMLGLDPNTFDVAGEVRMHFTEV